MKSTQRLKDAEKELRYVVRYIKVGEVLFCHRSFNAHCRPTSYARSRDVHALFPTISPPPPTQHSTEAAVEESERVFTRLIRSIEKQRSEVKELLRFQERAAVTQAEELLEKIQREVVEVRRADAELEKLSGTQDHIHFLQVHTQGKEHGMWDDILRFKNKPQFHL